MQSEDGDIAVPILLVLALIVGIGVYHKMTQEAPKLTQAEIAALLEPPAPEEER